MISVSDETKTAYLTDSTSKSLTVTFPNRNIIFTNSDLVSESVELTESIETGESLSFKGCISSQIKFSVAEIVTDLRSEYVEVSIQSGTTDVIPLFKGYVDSQDNLNYEDVITQFTCYDRLNIVGGRNMQSFIDSLTFPMTVKAFRDALFTSLGITQESTTLVNDSLSISANVVNYLENPTALDLMRWVCQLNGRFGQLGRDGVFYYRELKPISEGLYPSETTYPGEDTYPSAENAGVTITPSETKSVEYQPFMVEKISGVYIADADGITQGEVGNTTNPFVISDNPLAFNVPMMTAAQNLYAKISEIDFTPVISLDCVGIPYVECGDTYVTYTRLNAARSYVLNRSLKGIQALTDTFTSNCDQYQAPYKATATTRINANRKSVLQIQSDIVQMNELIATKATIEQLNTTNANIENLTTRVADVETLTATKANIEDLNATNASVNNLSARVASVENLTATKASITDLNATNASVNNLSARVASVESLTATKASITDLNATNANVSNLTTRVANVESLTAQKANISDLNATNATVNNLSASVANLNTVVANKIDASTVRANYMEVANWTTSGKIRADKISANLVAAGGITVSGLTCENNLTAESISSDSGNIKSVVCNTLTMSGHGCSFKKVVISGTTYYLLGYS